MNRVTIVVNYNKVFTGEEVVDLLNCINATKDLYFKNEKYPIWQDGIYLTDKSNTGYNDVIGDAKYAIVFDQIPDYNGIEESLLIGTKVFSPMIAFNSKDVETIKSSLSIYKIIKLDAYNARHQTPITKSIDILNRITDLKNYINFLPNSREKSSAITKLDETRHWITDIKDSI